jgi:hypothetical protein
LEKNSRRTQSLGFGGVYFLVRWFLGQFCKAVTIFATKNEKFYHITRFLDEMRIVYGESSLRFM